MPQSSTEHTSHTVAEYLTAMKSSPRFGPQVVHHERIRGRDPRFAELARPLSPELQTAMAGEGVTQLYSHQAAAIDTIRNGKDVIVATPTASGKSLIYNLPVAEQMMASKQSRALYLFPLKALAQDQFRRVTAFNALLPEEKQFTVAVCDGDTSSYRRKKLRENPTNIIISNPDMIHLSFLGYHVNWANFWAGLTHVVIDEVHSYRGIFGSHVSWVLRRLQRICAMHNAKPQFLLFSATVGNPAELAENLLGRPAQVITESGAPRGGKHFVFFNPWESAAHAASQMLEAALKRGLRTIVYTQSRKITELVSVWTRERLGELESKLTAYRAGFLPEERREIEHKLSSGELYGVVSTSAMELGIDIGALDICILVGYPGSIMSTWQRGGRVGRRQGESLIILIGQEDALDQHFMRKPADFFSRAVEAAVLNPANIEISKKHLLCAAAESPLKVEGDPFITTTLHQQAIDELMKAGELLLAEAGDYYFTSRKYPQRLVDLRGSGKPYAILRVGDNERLGEIDSGRCFKECHLGALYLHRGETWEVVDLDLEGCEVRVRRKDAPYFTRAMANKETEILKTYKSVRVRNIKASLGYLKVTDHVTGFQRKSIRGRKTISTEALDMPPQVFETEGLWFEVPASIEQTMQKEQRHFMGGIHAVEHAAIGVFPLQVLCDRNDVGGIAYPFHPQLQSSAIFIFDGYPGGVGLCREAFDKIDLLLEAALAVINDCDCEVGCPTCVHSSKCGSGNRPIDKDAACFVLEKLLKGDSTRIEISEQEPEPIQATTEPAGHPLARLPKRWTVFDVETQRSALEVGGWHKAHQMGVSVAVAYDGETDEYLTFREGEVDKLLEYLTGCDLVIGFNNKRFDNQVLSAYGDVNLHKLPTLDLLEEVKNRLGYRLSLDRLAEKTLGVQKSGNGLQALKWYKEGRIDKIMTYCQMDVEITRDLFLFALENGYLLFQNKAGQTVRCPLYLNLI